MVHVNPTTKRASGPHKEKFHNYLGMTARDKIDILYANWKAIPDALKNLIWEDIMVCPLNTSILVIGCI